MLDSLCTHTRAKPWDYFMRTHNFLFIKSLRCVYFTARWERRLYVRWAWVTYIVDRVRDKAKLCISSPWYLSSAAALALTLFFGNRIACVHNAPICHIFIFESSEPENFSQTNPNCRLALAFAYSACERQWEISRKLSVYLVNSLSASSFILHTKCVCLIKTFISANGNYCPFVAILLHFELCLCLRVSKSIQKRKSKRDPLTL